MDIVVKGRHCEVAERFRRHVQDKLAKVDKLDPKVMRIEVEVSREHNPRLSDVAERVELTLLSRGPAIRAEAAASDQYAALDLAWSKLETRLRRARDRRRVHHGGKTPVSLAAVPSSDGSGPSSRGARPGSDATTDSAAPATVDGVSEPVEVDGDLRALVIREKTHTAQPMSLEDAIYEMELVGHDFFLFVDVATRQPSVVYSRRGYSYGVIHLAM